MYARAKEMKRTAARQKLTNTAANPDLIIFVRGPCQRRSESYLTGTAKRLLLERLPQTLTVPHLNNKRRNKLFYEKYLGTVI